MFAALYAPSVPTTALIDVARNFTPRFETVGQVVLLDANGLSRLFGSAQELGEHLRDAVSELSPGDTLPRIAIASTQTAATLLALGSPGLTVVMPGKEAIALAPLTVGVLDAFERLSTSLPSAASPTPQTPSSDTSGWHHPRSTHQASRGTRARRSPGHGGRAPEHRLLEILTKWGIRTLGALTALSGPELHERLGERGVHWQSLARGIDARPMVPWVDEQPFEAALELEWPIEGLEPLSFVLARLLEPLADRLERADRGAAVLYTSLRLTSRSVFTRTLQLPAPMRDPKTLRTLILLDLESHPPDAPIDIVRVLIEPTPARIVQWTLLERAQPAPEQVSTLVARLGALMGEGRVGSPRTVDTWKPGAFAMSDFGARPIDPAPRAGALAPPSRHGGSVTETSSDASHLNSALRRFRFPIPTRVVVSEGRPVRVQTDRQGFTSGAIVQAAGPWRTSGDWWGEAGRGSEPHRHDQPAPPHAPDSHAPWDRDEWDVAMADGTVYRLVVERDVGQWFLEGVID